jgi:hypothetical protein
MTDVEELYNETQRKFHLIEGFIHEKIKEIEDKDFNWHSKKNPNHSRHAKLTNMISKMEKDFNFMAEGCVFDQNFQDNIDKLSVMVDEKTFTKIMTQINIMAHDTGNRRRESLVDEKNSLIKDIEQYFGKHMAHHAFIEGLNPEARDLQSSPIAIVEASYRDLSRLNTSVFRGVRPAQEVAPATLSAESLQLVEKIQKRIEIGREFEGKDKKKDLKTKELSKKLPAIKQKLLEVEIARESVFVINDIIMELKQKQREVMSSPVKKLNVDFSKAISLLEKTKQNNHNLVKKSQKQLEEITKISKDAEFETNNIELSLTQEQDAIKDAEYQKILAEQEANKTISAEAYTMYDAYQKSGTGKTFPNWCLEDKGLTQLPEGWEKIEQERLASMKEYQSQQTQIAEASKNEISIDATTLYDAYLKSGTGKPFPNWCLEDKGLKEPPKGWEKIQEERLAGMHQYQQQQTQAQEDDFENENEDDTYSM